MNKLFYFLAGLTSILVAGGVGFAILSSGGGFLRMFGGTVGMTLILLVFVFMGGDIFLVWI